MATHEDAGETAEQWADRFKAPVENSNDGILLVDSDSGTITSVNPALARMFGYTVEEMEGMLSFDLAFPDDLSKAREIFCRVVRGEKIESEVWRRRKDGEGIWVETRPVVIEMEYKNFMMTAVREMTEWKRAEEELKASEEKYRHLVENANDAIYLVDVDSGTITSANPALARMYGYTIEEMEGKPVFELHYSEDLDHARAVFSQILKEVPVTEEFRTRRKNGDPIWVEVKSILIELRGQKVVMSVTRDITERKRLEEELRESEERFRDLYEEAPIAYFAASMDSRIQMVNRNAENLLGYGRDKLIGRSVLDLYADTPEGKVKAELLNQRILKGEEINGEELEMRRIDGSSVWISLTVQLIKDTQGRFIERRAMAVDITKRKRAEEKLRASEEERLRAVSEMAASVGHNFNNLLTELQLRAQLMEQEADNAEAVIRDAKAIEETVQSATNIVERLQTLTKQSLSVRTNLDINRVALDTVEMTRLSWHDAPLREGRHIEIITELDATLPLLGDPVRLQEVLTNVIFNSVDAMPNGGTITIETDQQEGHVLLSVSDTGTGMDEETKHRLFEPFFTTKGGYRTGRGLGLSTVYSIVRQHGGTIEVETLLGQGTTFTIKLPILAMGS